MKQEAVTTESLIEIMNHQLEIIDNKDSVIEEKNKTIADLQQKLDYMLRQKFASSSEKFASNQPSLFQDTDTLPTEDEPNTETITFIRKKRGNKERFLNDSHIAKAPIGTPSFKVCVDKDTA